eukprot:GHVP01001386.1.p1 GENE.GHVP01001386.1~~GHVP01001386.1.p1  ORF type:complete len:194 (+),score=23.88 GHVP01001386.1:111-692(+)
MQFVDCLNLNRICGVLRRLEADDRILKGRIELVSTLEKSPSQKKLKQKFGTSCKDPEYRNFLEVFVKIVSAMNLCHPDYDFSSVSPEDFLHVSFETVFSDVNYHLSAVAESQHPGFINELWDAVKAVIDVETCEIYSYEGGADIGDDPLIDEGGSFGSFYYYFYCKQQQRLLCLSGVSTSLESSSEGSVNAED